MAIKDRVLSIGGSVAFMGFVLMASLTLAPYFSGTSMAAGAEPGNSLPKVRISTSEGEMVIRLRPDVAPKTVENFLEYADSGKYEDTIFHRVIAGFMIQGGGYNADLERIATQAPIPNEAKTTLPNIRGSVAMARTQDPDSATSQFFINLADNAFLNKGANGAGYAVFGTVVEGMGVIDSIANMSTSPRGPLQDVPTTNVVIQGVSRVSASDSPNP